MNVGEKKSSFYFRIFHTVTLTIHSADANCHYNEVTVVSRTCSVTTTQYKKGRKDRGRPPLKMVLGMVTVIRTPDLTNNTL